jgi:hypothetical protein
MNVGRISRPTTRSARRRRRPGRRTTGRSSWRRTRTRRRCRRSSGSPPTRCPPSRPRSRPQHVAQRRAGGADPPLELQRGLRPASPCSSCTTSTTAGTSTSTGSPATTAKRSERVRPRRGARGLVEADADVEGPGQRTLTIEDLAREAGLDPEDAEEVLRMIQRSTPSAWPRATCASACSCRPSTSATTRTTSVWQVIDQPPAEPRAPQLRRDRPRPPLRAPGRLRSRQAHRDARAPAGPQLHRRRPLVHHPRRVRDQGRRRLRRHHQRRRHAQAQDQRACRPRR